jgi:DNA-binding CsgD family transcriptional regulator
VDTTDFDRALLQDVANACGGSCHGRIATLVDGTRLALDELWNELVAGTTVVRRGWSSRTHCYLLIERRPGARASRLAASGIDMLLRLLTGESQKCVAIDYELAPSTIALRCKICLTAMGLGARIARVPVLVMLAAHAACGARLEPVGAFRVTGTTRECWLLSSERPDLQIDPSELSSAECEVARLLIEGKTHAEMAQLRCTSERTIANQLGSVFRKLGVSGRPAVLAQLVQMLVQTRIEHPLPTQAYA